MRVKPIGSNQTEIHGMGCEVLFSYETPVALCGPDGTWYRTEQKHSSTTSKHINKWIPNGRDNPNVVMLPQNVLDNWEHCCHKSGVRAHDAWVFTPNRWEAG